ncbi:MAG: hypothetical protein KF906_03870 [Actinobacteria bacterium]|nr:hypothetical protein [Actinomycetota bacterium]
MSGLGAIVDRALRSRWYPVGLAVVAGIVAVATKHLVYPDLSWNRDEPVYLFQVDLLRDGQLTSTDGGYPAAFHPWLSAHHDGRFFTQYPLGWPLAILLGMVVGLPDLSLVLACALAVVGTYVLAVEVTGRRKVAAVAATLFLCSPIVAVQSGVYLTYLFATGLGTLFAAAVLAAVRTGARRWALAAGGLVGAVFITRPFDAVVWAGGVGVFVLVAERRRLRSLLRLLPAFLVGAVPFLVVQLVQNWWTTGSATTFAITAADPLDAFGFGDRRLMPLLDTFDYTPVTAVRGTAKHLFFLPWFVVGSHLGALVALFGAWRRRAERSVRVLLVLCVAFPIGYFPFWGIHISSLTTRISGPIYYIPVYAPLCILAALGFGELARWNRRATAAVVAACLLITVPVTVGRLGLNRHLGRIQHAWADAVAEIPDGAVVVPSPSPYIFYLAPQGITRPDAPGRVTYAVDADPELVDLVDRSGQPAYLVRASVPAALLAPTEDTGAYTVDVVPLDLVRGDALRLDVSVAAPRSRIVVVDVTVDDQPAWSSTPRLPGRGRAYVTAQLGIDRAAAGDDGFVVPAGGHRIDVTISLGSAADGSDAVPIEQQRLLVDADGTLRGLSPGRVYRPDPYALADGDLRWLDDVPSSSVTVTLSDDHVS